MLHCLYKKNKAKEEISEENSNFSGDVMKSTPVLSPFVSFYSSFFLMSSLDLVSCHAGEAFAVSQSSEVFHWEVEGGWGVE